jgi:hypothetical protein
LSKIGALIVGYNLFDILYNSLATFQHRQFSLAFHNCRCLVNFALAVGVVAMWNLHHLILRNLLLPSYYRCLLKVSVPWLSVSINVHQGPEPIQYSKYKDFLDTEPPIFREAKEPLQVDEWLNSIE